jgi:hypothetical protein
VSDSVSKMNISKVTSDPDTGESLFPDETQIRQLKSQLANRSGIPVATIRAEQEARLTQGIHQQGTAKALPEVPVAAAKSELPPGKTTPPPPRSAPLQLDAEQQAFLRFIIDHYPDTPVSAVYKALSLSWYKGNELREHLSSHGYLSEIETRLGQGRRPMKFFLPTLQAFELLGVDPPTGRGGSIHRYIQQLVVQGAEAKGYTTSVEKDIGNGGIVDVHVERGEYRIAVEIAVYSTVERELAHIRHALSAGYDTVYGVFLDEHLLARTQEALATALTEEEAEKVRLVPVSKLSGIG